MNIKTINKNLNPLTPKNMENQTTKTNKELNSFFFEALKNSDRSACRHLISKGADVNTRFPFEDTPLIIAAKKGSLKLCELLIKHGADINPQGDQQLNPLQWASAKGYPDIIELLIKHGADVNSEDMFNQTPLFLAANSALRNINYGNESEINCCKMLIKHGASFDSSIKGGKEVEKFLKKTNLLKTPINH